MDDAAEGDRSVVTTAAQGRVGDPAADRCSLARQFRERLKTLDALAHRLRMNPSDRDVPELIALIAHELRSPSAVVAGYLRLLIKDGAEHLPERERLMIEEAHRSCGRLLRVVRELGDLASLEGRETVLSPSPVPIFALCDEVVGTIAPDGDATVSFSCADDDRPTVVQGNSSWLKRAVGALVSGTHRECGGGPLEAYGFVSRDDGAPHAIVALGRPGIGSRRADIVLNREVSFDRWRGGTGMSVPIACRIVEAHGGQIWSLAAASRTACAFSLPVAIA